MTFPRETPRSTECNITDLLLFGRLDEDLLHVFPHIQLVQALVTFIEHKLRQLFQHQILVPQEAQDATRCADQHMRATLLEHFAILRDRHTSIHDASFHFGEVLREAIELVLDLVSELAGVANDEHSHGLLGRVDLLQTRKHEHGRFPHAGLGLTKDVRAKNGLRDAFVLHLRRMLEPAVDDRPKELRLQQEVSEARCMNGSVTSRSKNQLFKTTASMEP